MEALSVDQLTNHVLLQMNDELAKRLDGDCVFINCDMFPPLDDEFRVVVEDLTEGKIGKHLIVMLQTPGGYMENVERIVSVMRANYKKVSFVIPNYAYSAGTVLVMSGDEIYMDYYSVLGPIDPQYPSEDGKYLPGMGYLSKFNELIEAINTNDPETPYACKGELAYLVKNFDPAQLFHIEQSIAHGITLITDWLSKYKFKNWKITETNGNKVNKTMREARAKEIATVLGNAKKWHSHGRGITMKELAGEEIKLVVEDFGSDQKLNDAIRNYHGLAVDYYQIKSRVKGFIHSKLGMRRVL